MIRSMTRFGLGIIVALTAALLPQSARAVTYTAADTFDLNPFLLGTNSGSVATGAFSSQQVGYGGGGNTGGNYHALLWTGTAASAVDLNPDALLGANSYSQANATSGSQQVGDGAGDSTGGKPHALLWTGYNTSAVDLNPNPALLGTNTSSQAYGTSGSQQVGSGSGGNSVGNLHALLWAGTAASAVDLNPDALLGANSYSQANATSGSQQVGYGAGGATGNYQHALLWTGTAASGVDLHPAAMLGSNSNSIANGISGGQQVGYGYGPITAGASHALLWSGSAASALDINPATLLGASSYSIANATNGSQQVGYGYGVSTGGNFHALLWAGAAASAVDLNTLLPSFTSSQATAIDPYGNIVGSASNGSGSHAVVWLAGDLYTGFGGPWNNNWTAGTPTAGNDVLLIQTDNNNRLVSNPNYSPGVVLGQITIDATGAGTMTVSQTQATLTSTSEIIGFLGAGTFNQYGGTHTVIGTMTLSARAGSQGTYNLGTYDPSGSAALHAGSILLNSGGTFSQIGGTLYAGTFTQAGGTVNVMLQNQGNFVYQSGAFNGRLLNQGTVNLGPSFTADNGVENDAAMILSAGQTLIVNGAGLDNLGTFTLSGGTISGAGPAINDFGGTLLAYGTINPPLTNDGSLTVNGVLALNGGAANNGLIQGSGVISGGFANVTGTVNVAAGNALAISRAWTNSGLVTLQGASALLGGGTITNTGSIQGAGLITSNIANTGTVEALGGTLSLGGTLTNPAGGLLTSGTGTKVIVTPGLATNGGVINLTGGTFDNNGHPLNNTGQISGWGIFRTGGSGLDNNGSITFSGGLTMVNGPVTNENGKTIAVAQNPAIFTGMVTNNGGATFNTVNATATFAGGFTNNGNSNFAAVGNGTVDVPVAPAFGNASSLAIDGASAMRFSAVSGAATVGAGVTAVVSSSATLELAGSVSALSSGANRVSITNNSTAAAGILVSGTNQVVGDINGSGTTQVNAGSDLTANHIIQSALVIGGTAGNHGLVTIDASDASGNPLAESSPQSNGPSLAGSLTPSDLSSVTGDGTDLAALSLGNSAGGGNPSSVPEPSTLVLMLVALSSVIGQRIAARRRTRRNGF